MLRLNRHLIAGALLALPMLPVPLRAAEPPMPGWPAAADPVVPPVVPVVPPVVALVPIDPRTGRCLAGFARNALGACVRHDEPTIACDTPTLRPGSCTVAAPSLTPYGLGPNRRLDY